jgi:hypothetical protein
VPRYPQHRRLGWLDDRPSPRRLGHPELQPADGVCDHRRDELGLGRTVAVFVPFTRGASRARRKREGLHFGGPGEMSPERWSPPFHNEDPAPAQFLWHLTWYLPEASRRNV